MARKFYDIEFFADGTPRGFENKNPPDEHTATYEGSFTLRLVRFVPFRDLLQECAEHLDGVTGAKDRPDSDSGDLYQRIQEAISEQED